MRTTILLSLLALTLSSACSSETGILVQTTTVEGFDREIDFLRFYVGEKTSDDSLYYSDTDPLADVKLEGRDIGADPYALLLRPGTNKEGRGAVVVAVLAYNAQGRPVGFGRLADPVDFISGSVLEWGLEIGDVGPDVLVGDHDCLEWELASGDFVHVGRPEDADCDGFTVEEGDCNDFNPEQSPGVPEDCSNGIDDNCNKQVDTADVGDGDEDGFAACGPEGERDCDDSRADVNPGADELCDGVDNNCDGVCDEDFDDDGDSITRCGSVVEDGQCVAMGEPDCNNDNEHEFPGNPEVCDGLDNDCSGVCDDDPSLDPDGDGYTQCGSVLNECGTETFLVDCEPGDEAIHPGAQELCDGVDNDCDGEEAESSPCFVQVAETCQGGTRSCVNGVLEDECSTQDNVSLPLGLCTSYGTCDDDPSISDPLVCVLDAASQDTPDEICQVTIGGDSQCDRRRVEIIPDGGPVAGVDCIYAIVGGREQQGYRLDLQSESGGSGGAVIGCTAFLEVRPLPGAGEAHVFIAFDDGTGNLQSLHVKLRANRILECGQALGLDCATWPTLNATTL